ncbi:MAG: cytidine deaminase [Candidatus Lokiarchaeota archaeon]|nr:cytidine deaminase [Candidatus Lokiarchaeota archaeon]
MEFEALYQKAKSVLNPRKLSDVAEAGGVGAALLSEEGNVYTGVCIDTACSMGFCAELAAAAAMITAGESHVKKMVAVGCDGAIIAPCGRCREFISQLDERNLAAEVLVADGVVKTLRELLPFYWRGI